MHTYIYFIHILYTYTVYIHPTHTHTYLYISGVSLEVLHCGGLEELSPGEALVLTEAPEQVGGPQHLVLK